MSWRWTDIVEHLVLCGGLTEKWLSVQSWRGHQHPGVLQRFLEKILETQWPGICWKVHFTNRRPKVKRTSWRSSYENSFFPFQSACHTWTRTGGSSSEAEAGWMFIRGGNLSVRLRGDWDITKTLISTPLNHIRGNKTSLNYLRWGPASLN